MKFHGSLIFILKSYGNRNLTFIESKRYISSVYILPSCILFALIKYVIIIINDPQRVNYYEILRLIKCSRRVYL